MRILRPGRGAERDAAPCPRILGNGEGYWSGRPCILLDTRACHLRALRSALIIFALFGPPLTTERKKRRRESIYGNQRPVANEEKLVLLLMGIEKKEFIELAGTRT